MITWETYLFLQCLFGCVPPERAECITLTAIHPDGEHPVISRHTLIGSQIQRQLDLERLSHANDLGWGAFVSMATCRPGLDQLHRGTRGDLVSLSALFLDVDEPLTAKRQRDLNALRKPPSCLVRSGGGYHSYWFLAKPTGDFAAADLVLLYLASRFGGCHFASTQPMRLPGTMNTKPERHGARCQIVELHDERRYSFTDFLPHLAALPALQAFPGRNRARRPTHHRSSNRDTHQFDPLNPVLISAIVKVLVDDYGGFDRRGWIASLCPCGHTRDHPGKHFNFNATLGIGHCFGRHGRLYLNELCPLLGVNAQDYGGVYLKPRKAA